VETSQGRAGIAALAGFGMCLVANPAPGAQNNHLIRQQRTVSLALANRIATATIDACRAAGRPAVVAVVDRGGNLVALQRGDDIGPHNTLAAQKKAFTALSTTTSTGLLAERASADPASRNLNTVDTLLLLGGGLPITFDREVVGAVGVAGSGGSAQDEACATKGIAAGMAAPSAKR